MVKPDELPIHVGAVTGDAESQAARHIAARLGQPAGEDEAIPDLVRRLTAALEAEPVVPGPSPLPSAGRGPGLPNR